MKNTNILFYGLLLSFLFIPTNLWAQKKETIIISGKVTVKDNGKPPIGLITVLEEDAVTHWAFGDAIGTNNHTFIQKDGTFKLTIKKGSTIIITDNWRRYKELKLEKLEKSQNINLKMERITGENIKNSKYPPTQLLKEEKAIDPSKTVLITGKIVTIKGLPINNVFLEISNVYNQNYSSYSKKNPEKSRRMNAFATNSKDGTFSYKIPKGTTLKINKGFDYNIYHFSPQKDTVINLKMHRRNPFK